MFTMLNEFIGSIVERVIKDLGMKLDSHEVTETVYYKVNNTMTFTFEMADLFYIRVYNMAEEPVERIEYEIPEDEFEFYKIIRHTIDTFLGTDNRRI